MIFCGAKVKILSEPAKNFATKKLESGLLTPVLSDHPKKTTYRVIAVLLF
jgi:hypothetical protein